MFCPLSADWGNVAQWVSGIAAISAILYALYRDNFSQYLKKHKLKFIEIVKIRQNSFWIYRLVLKNDSKHMAKNIEFDIEEIIENGIKRTNFLPAPHNWTHELDKSRRDIFPYQVAYLDLVTINELPNAPIALYARVLWDIPEMIRINKGTTILKYSYYSENGQTGNLKLQVNWNGKPTTCEGNLPVITIIH
jgi:hypothetical protein